MGTLIRQPGLTFLVSQTAEYALRAVVYLAQHTDGLCIAHDIADGTKVPLGYLQKILRMLVRAGLLTAQRGVGGGFALAKVPSAISVLDVLKAADANVNRIERCPLGIKGHTRLCALHRLLDEQIAHAERTFSSTSIADLLADDDEVRPLCDARTKTALTIESGRRTPPASDAAETDPTGA